MTGCRASLLGASPSGCCKSGLYIPFMTITPDTKDWTWVLHHACPECGLDTSVFPREAIAGMILSNAAAWREVLTADRDLHARTVPGKWSPLEYACHVRDVFRIYDRRLELMLTTVDPHYPNWDQDETAVAERYGQQDPATVAEELSATASALATRFAGINGDQWERTGNRSDGARFTVETFGRYFIHDPVHHLYDVTGDQYLAPLER
jgi:DinB superfamily